MKHLLSKAIITMVVAALFGFGRHTEGTTNLPDKMWVIAPRFLFLQEGVSKDEARKWLEEQYLPLFRQFPGFNTEIGEHIKSSRWGSKDAADKEKDFVMIYSFDSQETYDRYFTKDGSGPEIIEGIKKNQSTYDQLFGKYFIQERYQFEDYLMFASSK